MIPSQPAPLAPLARTLDTPVVEFGDDAQRVAATQVYYTGLAPGWARLYQVNVTVPEGVQTGDAVEVRLNIGGQTSNVVTIAVRP